jgi:hypothetical protein
MAEAIPSTLYVKLAKIAATANRQAERKIRLRFGDPEWGCPEICWPGFVVRTRPYDHARDGA